MASEVYINIKDLPELSQINNGDYIIVETSTGTHILNFENLLMPTQNTVITTTVNQNASAFNSYVTNLSTNLDTLFSSTDTLSSDLQTLSSSFESNKNSLSALANTYINYKMITIKAGDYTSSIVIDIGSPYYANNIIISPVNKYAALYPAYVDTINSSTNLITLRGTFNTKNIIYTNTNTSTLSVNNGDLNAVLNTLTLSTVLIPAEEDALYNIFVIKT
jgi:hypothetical protein